MPQAKDLAQEINMSVLCKTGEVKRANDIGFKGYSKFAYEPCTLCRKERWVRLNTGVPIHSLCISCGNKKRGEMRRGQNAHQWNGGYRTQEGYIFLRLEPNDFFYPMAIKKGYIREHRLVMAKHLGRILHKWEIVHHKNRNKLDNKIGNLELVDRHMHLREHRDGYKEGYIEGFHNGINDRIQKLKDKAILLEAELYLLKVVQKE